MIEDALRRIVHGLIQTDIDNAIKNDMEEQLAVIKPAEQAENLEVKIRLECKSKMMVPVYLDRLLRSCAEFLGLTYEDLMGILKTYHEALDGMVEYETTDLTKGE